MGRPEILAAAEELFSQKGYRATTMRDISQALGIKAGSLYSHISSKDELLVEIMNDVADNFCAAAARADAMPGTAPERLRQYMVNHLCVVEAHPAMAAVLTFEWRALEEHERGLMLIKRDESEAHLDNILRDGISSGQFRPIDQKWARLLVLSVLNWASQWFKTYGPMTAEQIADEFFKIIIAGMVT